MTKATAKKSEATLLRPPFSNNTSEGTKNRINTNRPGVKLVPPIEKSIGGKNIPTSAIHTTSIFPPVDARDVLTARPLVLSSAIILTTTLGGLRLSAAVSPERLPPAQPLQGTHRSSAPISENSPANPRFDHASNRPAVTWPRQEYGFSISVPGRPPMSVHVLNARDNIRQTIGGVRSRANCWPLS
jgi:hypothetical protein